MTTAKDIAEEGLRLLYVAQDIRLDWKNTGGDYNTHAITHFTTLARAHIEQEARMRALVAEIERLHKLLWTPENEQFTEGVIREAAHQVARWPRHTKISRNRKIGSGSSAI